MKNTLPRSQATMAQPYWQDAGHPVEVATTAASPGQGLRQKLEPRQVEARAETETKAETKNRGRGRGTDRGRCRYEAAMGQGDLYPGAAAAASLKNAYMR